MHDKLTGLYDRTKFFDCLKKIVREAVEYSYPFGLLFIDIRRFNQINTNYGHITGDLALQGVANVLKSVCRDGDILARIGDDQFALVLSRIANQGHAELAAHKIQRLLDVPIETDNRMVRCKTTIGIGLFPNHAHDIDSLIKITSRALSNAKKLEQPIGVLDYQESDGISENWDIEIALPDAISNSELVVYFQPKIDLSTGKPMGAEALVRWQHPSRGLIPPGNFLPIAEESGFIKPLSIWVLNNALRHSCNWTDKWGKLCVSVNIPPSMMVQPDFVDLILSTDKLWPSDSSYLCIEILEESLIEDVTQAFTNLKELRDSGIQVSIDDFGTGYSSLSYFKDIPAGELKIDRSFIQTLSNEAANKKITSLIIEMSKIFGLKVVAEGVEDAEALNYLRKRGCDYVQGYYLAKPMPALEFQAWLESYSPVPELYNTISS